LESKAKGFDLMEDPRNSALLLIGCMALAGAYLPAWCAARLDPMNALRRK
jgi:hypothetical protein